MVSIRDVAKHAGVAISTVSKVLNNYPNVSEATKKKVNDAVKELNFVPNTVAAALSSKQAGRVAVLLKVNLQTVMDEINMQYLTGAMNQAEELGLDVITVFYSMIRNKSIEELISYFRVQSISGIVIFGMNKTDKVLQQLIELEEFKIVVVDAPFCNASTTSMWIDQESSQYEIAKMLITENESKGYKSDNVLYIAGSDDGYVTERRTEAMTRLEEDLGVRVQIYNGKFSELEARNITLEHAKESDIIVCASDMMAIGAMRALIDMDVYKPVCGFDGIRLMAYAGKHMYTVKQDFARIGACALAELKQLMNGEKGRRAILDYEIVQMKYQDAIQ